MTKYVDKVQGGETGKMPTFAQRFKEEREKRGWTQEDIAERLGVSRPSIAGYESKDRTPRKEMLSKIADLFGVTIDYLLGRTTYELEHIEEENKATENVIAEKFLEYLTQGLSNEEIAKRLNLMSDIFTLTKEQSDEFIDFVRRELATMKEQQTASSMFEEH